MKKTARRMIAVIIVAAVVIGVLGSTGCSSGQGAAQSGGGSSTQSSAAGSNQVLPVAKNPIVNDATRSGLAIVSAMVEDNVDPTTNQDIADRLQINLENTGDEAIADLEVYYEMTDITTKKTEGYYQKLTGFSLAAGAQGSVFFDNAAGAGHYPENRFSLYRTSANEVHFSIEVSAAGYAPARGEAVKAVGTGENPGE